MGRTKLVVAYLAEYGALPGVTRGDIRNALGLPDDAEVTARIRESRTSDYYGRLDVRCMQISKTVFKYWMPRRELKRARSIVSRWVKEENELAKRRAA